MKRLAVFLLLIGCTETGVGEQPAVTASSIGHDIAGFAYAPRQAELAGCGLSLAIDPSWTVESTSGTDEKGDRRWSHVAVLQPVEPSSAVAEGALASSGSVSVSRLETPISDDGSAFLQRYTRTGPEAIAEASLSAPGRWWRSVASVPNDRPGSADFLMTVVSYASVEDGAARILRISLPDRRVGGVAEVVPARGDSVSADGVRRDACHCVGRPTQIGTDGTLTGIRSTEENVALAERIAATML